MTPHPARPAKPWRDPNPDELAAQVAERMSGIPDIPEITNQGQAREVAAIIKSDGPERAAEILTEVADPRPLSVSDLIVAPRIDRTRPQHPQLRIWNGEPWVDPRDLLWHDELDAAVARHPAGKARP